MQAEKLNTHAANALLKTLEEPGTNKCLILSAHAASLLPPTIVSRCHILLAPTPDWTQATAWLQARGSAAEALAFAGGMPIAALSADLAGAKAAAKFFARGKKMNLHATAAALMDYENWLDCLQKWTAGRCAGSGGIIGALFSGRGKIHANNLHRYAALVGGTRPLAGKTPFSHSPFGQRFIYQGHTL